MKNSFFKILIMFLFPLFSIAASAETEIELSGKLVKKYYKASSVQNLPFGWFIELDNSSKASLNMFLSKLDVNEKQISSNFDINIIQLMLNRAINSQACRDLENHSVHVKGLLWNPVHPYRPIPSHQLTISELRSFEKKSSESIKESLIGNEETLQYHEVNNVEVDDTPLELPEGSSPLLVTLQGSLQLKLYPGPPNYESIENGDYPERCWMLQMDSKSFDVASHTLVLEPALSMMDIMSVSNSSEVQLGLETHMREFCKSHINQKVTIQGYLSHAILAHHYAPFLMSVQSIHKTE
jgi:hypothetical protein